MTNVVESSALQSSVLIRMFADSGNLFEANQVFAKVLKPNVFTWTAIISAHAKLRQGEKAIALYHKMQQSGVEPDKHILLAVLKACSSIGALNQGNLIHIYVVKNGFEFDISLVNSLIDMYTKCGSLMDARMTFAILSRRDIVTWSAMITGYAQYGHGREALLLYQQMQQEGFEPNNVTYTSILKACSSMAALNQGKFIHAHIIERGFESHTTVGNTLIDMYAKCGNLKEAQRVFDKVPKEDLVTWNAIIAGYAQQGRGQEALHLFGQMQQEGNKPDRFTFVSALKACSSIAAIGQGVLVHAYLIETGFDHDVFVSNTIIDLYAKCGKLEDARQVFDHSLKRPVVTWSAMIAGYVQHGKGYEAFQLFLEMQQVGNKPDDATFVSIIKACSIMTALNQGKLVHFCATQGGFDSNMLVESALIHMYIKCGCLEDAGRLFDRSSKHDVVAWSGMIAGYVEHGFDQKALQLFRQMSQEGVEPNCITFISTLKACSSIAALCQGMSIHTQVNQYGLVLDIFLGNALIDMYAKSGSLKDARRLFAKLPARDVVTWNAMIAGFAICGDYKLTLQYFEEMQEEGLKPDDVTFICILSTCSQLGLVDRGCQHFVSMRVDHGMNPTIEHYNCVADLFGRVGHLKGAEDILALVPCRSGILGWMSLLSNCTNYGNVELGSQCFDHILKKNRDCAPGYVLMSNIYAGVDMLEDAGEILQQRIFAHGWKKVGLASIEVDDRVYDFTVGDQSHQQSSVLNAKLKRLSEQTVHEGHVPQPNSVLQLMLKRDKKDIVC